MRSSGGVLDGGSAWCSEKCNNQTYLRDGLGVLVHHLCSFLFGCYRSLLQKNAGVVAADDGLEGCLLQGGMLSLVGRWLLIGVLQVCDTLIISRTHEVGIGGVINF